VVPPKENFAANELERKLKLNFLKNVYQFNWKFKMFGLQNYFGQKVF
jgi:hypothetical protein